MLNISSEQLKFSYYVGAKKKKKLNQHNNDTNTNQRCTFTTFQKHTVRDGNDKSVHGMMSRCFCVSISFVVFGLPEAIGAPAQRRFSFLRREVVDSVKLSLLSDVLRPTSHLGSLRDDGQPQDAGWC